MFILAPREGFRLIVLKFSREDTEHLVDGLFLEVGALEQLLFTHTEYILGGIQTDGLERIEYPLVDLVVELIQIDIVHVSLADLAQHISEHNSVFSKGTTVGILTELSSCIRELLLQGYSIDLGDLGRLTPSITSTGAVSLKDFTADNIQKVNVKFTNGSALLKLREDAEFEQTTSRAAQAAALKAAKDGLTTADWTPQEDGEGGEEEEPEP